MEVSASNLAAVAAAAPANLHVAVVVMVPAHGDHARAPYGVTTVIIVGDVTLNVSRSTARAVELDVNPRRTTGVSRFRSGRGNHCGDTEGEDSDQFLHGVELGFTVSDDPLPRLFKIPVIFSPRFFQTDRPFPMAQGRIE
jgi:hypothetical protein